MPVPIRRIAQENGMSRFEVSAIYVLIVVGMFLLAVWAEMLLLGALAIETGWPTAIGFKATLMLTGLLVLVGSVFNYGAVGKG